MEEPTASKLSNAPTAGFAPVSSDAPVPERVGSYELVRELGRGGMGVVWLARDTVLDREVAVKLMLGLKPAPDDPAFRTFLDGAKQAVRVEHPSLNRVHHAGMHDGIPYLVMAYIDGETLADRLERGGPMGEVEAVRMMIAVCDAVGALHDEGIIHRDIKPGNIMFTRDGTVQVTDFGLACARRADHGEDASSLVIAGSPGYMAPEVFRGEMTARSDVYSLGVTLLTMLEGPMDADRLRRAEVAGAASPGAVSMLKPEASSLAEIVANAMSFAPGQRYRSANQMLADLVGFAARLAGGASKSRSGPKPRILPAKQSSHPESGKPVQGYLRRPRATVAAEAASSALTISEMQIIDRLSKSITELSKLISSVLLRLWAFEIARAVLMWAVWWNLLRATLLENTLYLVAACVFLLVYSLYAVLLGRWMERIRHRPAECVLDLDFGALIPKGFRSQAVSFRRAVINRFSSSRVFGNVIMLHLGICVAVDLACLLVSMSFFYDGDRRVLLRDGPFSASNIPHIGLVAIFVFFPLWTRILLYSWMTTGVVTLMRYVVWGSAVVHDRVLGTNRIKPDLDRAPAGKPQYQVMIWAAVMIAPPAIALGLEPMRRCAITASEKSIALLREAIRLSASAPGSERGSRI